MVAEKDGALVDRETEAEYEQRNKNPTMLGYR